MWIPVLVAVIAAGASAFAAVQSRRSAGAARASSERIDSRRHAIAALDRDAETFSSALDSFLASCGSVRSDADIVPLVFAGEQLRAHHKTSEQLDAAVVVLQGAIRDSLRDGRSEDSVVAVLKAAGTVRKEARAVAASLAEERVVLTASVDA